MSKNISRTLIIGLGGTGQTLIREIKKRLLRTYGEIPPLVKFLAFDTDALDRKDSTPFSYYYKGQSRSDLRFQIDQNEFLRIPCPSLDQVKNDPVCNQKLDLEKLNEVYARLKGFGAGGYRVMGRAHFLNSSAQIIKILQSTIANLTNSNLTAAEIADGYNLATDGKTAYVIGSLSGGTGSSSFLDLSRMLQLSGFNMSYAGSSNDQVYGVFFLPGFLFWNLRSGASPR